MEPIIEEPVSLIPSPPLDIEDGTKKDPRPLPMPQKQFNLLTQVFKGSATHTPSPHGRKPSVLKLSKRTESEDIKDEKNALVTFASRDEIEPSHHILSKARDPSEGFRSILKRTEHALDVTTIASPLHRLELSKELKDPTISAGTEPSGPTEHILTEAEKQEQRLQALLASIEFQTQRDQSISTIDIKVRGETQWLHNQPSNEKWTDLVGRVNTQKSEDRVLHMAHQNDIADRFLDTFTHSSATHVNNLLNGADNEKERLVVRLTFALLNDVVDGMIGELSAEIALTIKQASGILNKSLVKSLASVSLGMEGSSSRFWKMSGREYVLKGALLDSLRPPTNTSSVGNKGSSGSSVVTRGIIGVDLIPSSGVARSTTVYDKNDITITQPTLHSKHTTTIPIPPPLHDTLLHIPPIHYTASSGENGYDSDDSDAEEYDNVNTADTNNTINKTTRDHLHQLHTIEVAHWSGVNFTSLINSPLQIPSTIASSRTNCVVSCVRVFPLSHVLYASLLVCGLCNGRVVVYTIRYTGEPADIVCTTALPPKSQQSPIVDIKCGSSGPSSIVCMNSSGVVSVYHINTALSATTTTALLPVQRKKWSLFSYNTAKKSNNMPLVYTIQPNDMIFTYNTLQDTINASKVDKSEYNDVVYDTVQPNVTTTTSKSNNKSVFSNTANTTTTTTTTTNSTILPTTICFHPSTTLFGTNVSFMVGAINGDIIKYNMDYVQDNMASTIIYPTTPFIQKEYIHPNNAIKGFVLTNGISEKYGNKVYRELFHYHKHKIVLLDVINTISPYIVSMDQSGRVALWYYNSEYFEGKCWFRPFTTTKLVLNVVDMLPTGEYIEHSVYNSVGDSGNTIESSDVHTTLPTTGDNTANNNSNTTPSTDLDERVKSQLTVREAFVDNTPNRTVHTDNTSSGTATTNALSGSSIVGNRIHKIYNPVYNAELDVYVQYSSVEYDVVVDDEPVVSGTGGDNSGNGGDSTIYPIVDAVVEPITTLPTAIDTTNTTNISATATLPPTTNTTNTTNTTSAAEDNAEYSSRVVGRSLRRAAASPVGGSGSGVREGRASSGAVPVNTSSVETAGGSGDGDIINVVGDSSTSGSVKADPATSATPIDTNTTIADGGTNVSNVSTDPITNGSVSSNRNLDANGIRVFSDAPDTTTIAPSDSTSVNIVNSTTNIPTTDTDTSTNVVVDTTTKNNATNTTSDTPPLTTIPHVTSSEGENKEAGEEALSKITTEPAALALQLPTAVPDTTTAHTTLPTTPPNLTNTTYPNTTLPTHPIPVTIFTRITALIETYQQHEARVEVNFFDIDAEGGVPLPMLEKRGSGDNQAADMPPFNALPMLAPIDTGVSASNTTTTPPLTSTLPTVPPTTLSTTVSNTLPALQTIPAIKTKRVIEYTPGAILAERTLHFTIISSKMSYDGAEVVILVASKYHFNSSSIGTNTGGVRSTANNNTTTNTNTNTSSTNILTVYYLLSYFPLLQTFHPHYPRLYMNSDDRVVDYCIGPLQFETLTRMVFVLTKKCVRVFSLHTGREIITIDTNATNSSVAGTNVGANTNNTNNTTPDSTSTTTNTNTPLPFTWELPSFTPTTISVCPSQRVLTLSATDDARIAVYLLQHIHDGTSTSNTTEDAELLNRFKLFEKVRPAVKSVLPASEGTGIHTVLNIVTYIPVELQQITNEIRDILDLVYDHTWSVIERNLDHARRTGLINDMYDGDLGFIEPIVWPPTQEIPSLQISSAEPSAVHNTTTPRTRRHRKKKEKRIKNVGSVDSVETPREGNVSGGGIDGNTSSNVVSGGVNDGEGGERVGQAESEDEVSVMM